MKPETEKWVDKAEADRAFAKKAIRWKAQLFDGICFHCQQCCEKYLKAILEEQGLSIPKIHNLVTLVDLLIGTYPSLKQLRRGMGSLTPYAVAVRYPGDDATRRQATAAIRWMEQTRKEARKILGL